MYLSNTNLQKVTSLFTFTSNEEGDCFGRLILDKCLILGVSLTRERDEEYLFKVRFNQFFQKSSQQQQQKTQTKQKKSQN